MHVAGCKADTEAFHADLLANVTPIGMAGGADADAMAFSPVQIEAAAIVFDVVALPAQTPLIREAERRGKPVINGAEVIALQAAARFALDTGVTPTDEQAARASQFSCQ